MPKYIQPRKTWQYSNEFKVKAVQLSLIEGIQVQEVANTLDIHPFMLSRWRKEYREGKIVADKRKKLTEATSKQEKEISKIKKLEAENELQMSHPNYSNLCQILKIVIPYIYMIWLLVRAQKDKV